MMQSPPTKNGTPRLPKLVSRQPQPPLNNASELTQVNYLQRLVLWKAGSKSISGPALARLCQAFCLLGDRKRVLRGIPLPGQLRPDLDPVQLAKALSRQKSRQITDVQSSRAVFTEEPEGKGAGGEKESLQAQGVTTGSGGGEGQGQAGAL